MSEELSTPHQNESPVAREVAEADFRRMTEAMRIDVDPATMDDEDKEGFRRNREVIVKSVMEGQTTISDKGEPTYTPWFGDNPASVTFRMPTGATLMAMDRMKETATVRKMYAAMADMTGKTVAFYSSMAHPDLKICLAIATVFMG